MIQPEPEMLALGLFAGYGVELEYMIVDSETLNVQPISDRVIEAACGEICSEFERNLLCWSNELVLHVLEFKTNGPSPSLAPVAELMQTAVGEANGLLGKMGAQLLPTGMHPWMDPFTEARLWPHEYSAIYETFNKVFDCRGHGWSNLQSTHLNLPFHGDEEFGRLHAAIRLVLPILPALAAASPIIDGAPADRLDMRLEAYRQNCRRIPMVTGRVIPEPVFTVAGYQQKILEPMYRDVARFDRKKVIQHEWLNARGAIARFDRSTIEIRVLDVQECPQADLAIVALLVEVLKALCEERWHSFERQCNWAVHPLEDIFLNCVAAGETARIESIDYLEMLGAGEEMTAGELWRHLYDAVKDGASTEVQEIMTPVEIILDQGTLARRMLRALGSEPDRDRILAVYRELGHNLAEGRLFSGDSI